MAFKFRHKEYTNQDLPKFEKEANKILSNMSLKADFSDKKVKELKFLLLEGTTDEGFLKDKVQSNVKILCASNIIEGNKILLTDGQTFNENSKNYIKSICCGIEFDANFGDRKYNVYGIVDRDFDEEYPNRTFQKVLSNDTHDLETLMLKSEGQLLYKLNIPNFNDEDIKKVFFMAYQLGLVKYAIYNIDDGVNYSIPYDIIRFSEFFEKNVLNIEKYIQYLNKTNKKLNKYILNTKEINKLLDNIYKSMKKYVTNKGEWKISLNGFNLLSFPEDFYYIANGHDICNLILQFYLKQFGGNNKIEGMLIRKYDKSNFINTILYEKMNKEELIKN